MELREAGSAQPLHRRATADLVSGHASKSGGVAMLTYIGYSIPWLSTLA